MKQHISPIYIYLDQNHLIYIREGNPEYAELIDIIRRNPDKLKVVLSAAHVEETHKIGDKATKERHIAAVESIHSGEWLRDPNRLLRDEVLASFYNYTSKGKKKAINPFTLNYLIDSDKKPLKFGEEIALWEKSLAQLPDLKRASELIDYAWPKAVNESKNMKSFRDRRPKRLKAVKNDVLNVLSREKNLTLASGIALPKNSSIIKEFADREAEKTNLLMAIYCLHDLKAKQTKGRATSNDLQDLIHSTPAVYCDALLIENEGRALLENPEIRNFIRGKAFSNVKDFTEYIKELLKDC